jgi:hypothetical protein
MFIKFYDDYNIHNILISDPADVDLLSSRVKLVLLSRTPEGWFMMKLDVCYCDKDARHKKKNTIWKKSNTILLSVWWFKMSM